MRMRLSDLEGYDKITIQCHDNPDPDALASAFGLYRYFSGKGIKAQIIYSGKFKIRKSNLI
jgi:phosphoglycolate phosphatase